MKENISIVLWLLMFFLGCGEASSQSSIQNQDDANQRQLELATDISEISEISAPMSTPVEAEAENETENKIPCDIREEWKTEWEMDIKVGIDWPSSNSKNYNYGIYGEHKLSIGQAKCATDQIDGYYDIMGLFMPPPGMKGSMLKTFLILEGQEYWSDIRSACLSEPCQKEWILIREEASIDDWANWIKEKWAGKNPEILIRWQKPSVGTFLITPFEEKINMANQTEYRYQFSIEKQIFRIITDGVFAQEPKSEPEKQDEAKDEVKNELAPFPFVIDLEERYWQRIESQKLSNGEWAWNIKIPKDNHPEDWPKEMVIRWIGRTSGMFLEIPGEELINMTSQSEVYIPIELEEIKKFKIIYNPAAQ